MNYTRTHTVVCCERSPGQRSPGGIKHDTHTHRSQDKTQETGGEKAENVSSKENKAQRVKLHSREKREPGEAAWETERAKEKQQQNVMKTQRQILPNLAMAASRAAMKDWFFHLSHTRQNNVTLCAFPSSSRLCVCVCVCVWERGKPRLHLMEEEQQLRVEKQLYLFNACTAPLPLSLIPSLPEWAPHTPFLTLTLPQSWMARGFSLCTHAHAHKLQYVPELRQTQLVWASVLLSEDKYRQDACATEH